jgi:hypothetical protein
MICLCHERKFELDHRGDGSLDYWLTTLWLYYRLYRITVLLDHNSAEMLRVFWKRGDKLEGPGNGKQVL